MDLYIVRTLHNAPLFKKPEIGNNPFTPVENVPAEKSIDATHELMQIIINDYERVLPSFRFKKEDGSIYIWLY
jgi:hypothetical protein